MKKKQEKKTSKKKTSKKIRKICQKKKNPGGMGKQKTCTQTKLFLSYLSKIKTIKGVRMLFPDI